MSHSQFTLNLSGNSKGNDWEGRIYFINHNKDNKKIFNATELKKTLNLKENILGISKYKNPLSQYQITSYLLHHAFIVLETDKLYYSMEKNSKGIVIQISKKLADVKDYIGEEKRLSVTLLNQDNIYKYNYLTIKDIINYLEKTELPNQYFCSYMKNNCQGFGERLYEYIMNIVHLQFYNYVNNNCEKMNWNEMIKVINKRDKIKSMSVHKISNLSVDSYEFVIISSNKKYWSIEKNENVIIIQRSKTLENVTNKIEEKVRPTNEIKSKSKVKNKKIKDIIDHIETNKQKSSSDFANDLYDYFCSRFRKRRIFCCCGKM